MQRLLSTARVYTEPCGRRDLRLTCHSPDFLSHPKAVCGAECGIDDLNKKRRNQKFSASFRNGDEPRRTLRGFREETSLIDSVGIKVGLEFPFDLGSELFGEYILEDNATVTIENSHELFTRSIRIVGIKALELRSRLCDAHVVAGLRGEKNDTRKKGTRLPDGSAADLCFIP